MYRVPLVAVAAGSVLLLGCGRLTPASGIAVSDPPKVEAVATSLPASPSPMPTPTYQPGPDTTSGVVIRKTVAGVVINSGGLEIEVDLSSVIDVWKETSVPSSAIEVGDDLTLNGTGGSAQFFARYAWVNIGRLEGVIRSFDGRELVIANQRAGDVPREMRVELSRQVQVVLVAKASEVPADRADLVAGRSVGMVVYRPRNALPRATRIWLWAGP